MARVQQHTHKLKRHKYKSTGHAVFFCILDCGFKVDVGLALGKKTICWRCGNETPINEYSIRLARPVCMGCVKHKDTTVQPDVTKEVMTTTADSGLNSILDRMKQLTSVGVAEKEEEI